MKNKINYDKIKGIIAGVLISALTMAGVGFAKNATQQIEIEYSDISVFVDGEKIEPKDVNGNDVEPFTYNGTTYLPVRAIGEAIGKNVSWDEETNTVFLYDMYRHRDVDVNCTGYRYLTEEDTEWINYIKTNIVYKKLGKVSYENYTTDTIDKIDTYGIVSAVVIETAEADEILAVFYLDEDFSKAYSNIDLKVALYRKWIHSYFDWLSNEEKTETEIYPLGGITLNKGAGMFRNPCEATVLLTTVNNKLYLGFSHKYHSVTDPIPNEYLIFTLDAGNFKRVLYLADSGGSCDYALSKVPNYVKAFDYSVNSYCEDVYSDIPSTKEEYHKALNEELLPYGITSNIDDSCLFDTNGQFGILDIRYSLEGAKITDYTGLEKLLK